MLVSPNAGDGASVHPPVDDSPAPIAADESVMATEVVAAAETEAVAAEANAADDPVTADEAAVLALPSAEQIDWQAAARQALAQALHLPPAVRATFTRSIDDATAAVRDAVGRPMIPVVEAIAAVSAALPANWLQDPSALQRAIHPGGDHFFATEAGLSDERAAAIAQQQLAAAGYLRPGA